MSDDVFAGNQSSESVLDTLVGEGKKFSDAEALAKGKAQADEHISKIEQENAELKAKLEADKSGDDKGTTVANLMKVVQEAQAATSSKEGETMSTEELEKLVRSVVKDDKQADTKAANRAQGNELVLKSVDGNVEAAKALVAERAAAVGLTPAQLAELSENSPAAFAKLIEAGSTASSGDTSILPGQRTDAFGDTANMELDGYKTKAWFDAQRKQMGHVKYINDQTIQRELTRSMNHLGERFNN
jgi:hypothetical protein